MKRLTLIMMMAALATTVTAQTAREDGVTHFYRTAVEEIEANKYLAGSNYLDYDRQMTTQPLTPAPKGYTPFYMSHYGRHGSRWLISRDSYTSVVEPMRKARQYGKLTAKGEEVLGQLEAFVKLPVPNYPTLDGKYEGAQLRLGDLSSVGERQHHGIGRRMAQNFPEIFKAKNVAIDARSTVVVRCILSMMAECEELMAANPTARIHNEVSEALQYYLNAPRTGLVKAMGKKGREVRKQHNTRQKADRLMQVLFNDQQWVSDSINAGSLMRHLFQVVINMQSHDNAPDMISLFTNDEIYDMWRQRNAEWYVNYGPSPLAKGVMPFSQFNLLTNIIETADTCVALGKAQATMRFGHEVCVLPLACLMELDSCGIQVERLEDVEYHWRNYKIFPMACNIQLIFYKSKKAGAPVLVKALLNEREATLPAGATDTPYYYKWEDVRAYWTKKLADFQSKYKN